MPEETNPYMSGSYADLIDAQEKKAGKTAEPPPVKKTTKQPQTKKIAAAPPPATKDSVKTSDDDVIEKIWQTVKVTGKESAFYRLTPDEKDALGEVVYEFKFKQRPKITTTENEVARIAINYLLHEHQENKEQSILSLVLKKLRG